MSNLQSRNLIVLWQNYILAIQSEMIALKFFYDFYQWANKSCTISVKADFSIELTCPSQSILIQLNCDFFALANPMGFIHMKIILSYQ